MVGKVFREYGINLLYGESGVGKTISAIKALNEDELTPILLDFDNNDSPEFNECKYDHINGAEVLASEESIVMPVDRIIIVDTWSEYQSAGGTIEFLYRLANKNTVILIDHSKAIATKQDIPTLSGKVANHLSAKLYLERIKKDNSVQLRILKSRGYRGPGIIHNWMR